MLPEKETGPPPASEEGPKLPWRRISAFALAALTAVAVYLNWNELWTTLRDVNPLWLFAGIVLHLANYYFRALRLRLLTGGKLEVWPTGYRAIGMHGILTYLMPFRTGELALPALLRTAYGASWSEGVRLLVWARVMDMCALGVWVLVAAALLQVSVSGGFMALWVVCGLALTASPLLVTGLPLLGRYLPAKLEKHLKNLGGQTAFSSRVFLSSLGVWTMVGGALYCVARAVALPLGIGDIWFIVTVQLPLQLAPVQGVANAGNHEAGWVAALTMLGLDAGSALDFALATHALLLVFVAATALALALIQFWQHGKEIKHKIF